MTSSFKRAHDLQAAAAAVGFDWPELEDILDKAREELDELQDALRAGLSNEAVREEFGDILFVLVNLARRLKLTPETTLADACDKFERRFAHMRDTLMQRNLRPEQVDLDTLESLWQEAKRLESQADQ